MTYDAGNSYILDVYNTDRPFNFEGSPTHRMQEKTQSTVGKRKRRDGDGPRRPRKRFPNYDETLPLVRGLVEGFLASGRTSPFYKENIAKVHGLDASKVQRALVRLRVEGLVHRPVNNYPACDTWRGGKYDEYSAWCATKWYVRVPGYEVRFNTLSGPVGRWEFAKVEPAAT